VNPSDGRILLFWRSFGFRSDGVEGGFCFFVSLGFASRKKSLTSSPRDSRNEQIQLEKKKGFKSENCICAAGGVGVDLSMHFYFYFPAGAW
jgi:hypothetical protein